MAEESVRIIETAPAISVSSAGSVEVALTTPVYSTSVPTGGTEACVNGIGGRTVNWNQLIPNGNFASTSGWTANDGTITASSNVLTYTPTSGETNNWVGTTSSLPYENKGHKLYITAKIGSTGSKTYRISAWQNWSGVPFLISNIEPNTTVSTITTVSSDYSATRFAISCMSADASFTVENFMVIDLTQMYGAGNEPTSAEEFRAMCPADYYAYDTGSLQSAVVDSVIVKDANGNTTDTLTIPANLRTAYPLHSLVDGSVYDEYDFETLKHIQRVSVSGTTVTELSTYVETDISSYFPSEDFLLDLQTGGTITFGQTQSPTLQVPNDTIVHVLY